MAEEPVAKKKTSTGDCVECPGCIYYGCRWRCKMGYRTEQPEESEGE